MNMLCVCIHENMNIKLPKKLNKEPLIDAVFEVRFSSVAPASVILPGFLFNKLEGEKKIESFPISQLPKPVRDADPNIKYAPLSRIEWRKFIISISDFSVSVSCKYPYPGWCDFKPAVLNIIEILVESNIVNEVERYSMKYIDLFPEKDIQQVVGMFNLEMSIAGHKLEKEQFHLRIDVPKDGFMHTVQVVSLAQAVLSDGTKKEGAIIDIDTAVAMGNSPIRLLADGISEKLDSIHSANKNMFFSCLKSHAIDSLEPNYD
jgi:uncharacterized protein (TIGR04255 family)